MKRLLCAGLALLALTGAAGAAKADDLVAAVLPSSRSGVVGKPVTVFATMINSSGSDASGCAISTSESGLTLTYQATNPQNNQPIGSPNTPVAIANGAAQTFVLTLVSSVPLQAVDVPFTFDCTGLVPAQIITGLDTLTLSMAVKTPEPDIVALATTVKGNGVVSTAAETGSAAFAVASIDVGAAGAITVTPNLGDLSMLPVTLAVCQTDEGGNCMATPAGSVSYSYPAGGAATFGVFVTFNGPVPFAPASARVYVDFTDSSNVIRGKTSVALTATPNPFHPGATPGGIYIGM